LLPVARLKSIGKFVIIVRAPVFRLGWYRLKPSARKRLSIGRVWTQGTPERENCRLEQFFNSCVLCGCVQGGLLLRKKATYHPAFGVQQLENGYKRQLPEISI
jgi:hypothetical protein